jgi:hypothetical protein
MAAIFKKLFGFMPVMKKAFAAGVAIYALRYGRIDLNPDLLANYDQHLESTYSYHESATVGDDEQSLTESQSVSSIRVKTGSGAMIEIQNHQNQTPEALKSTLEIRSGSIEGAEASTVDGFGVKPQISHNRPSSSKSLNS